jgi:hypothetical protein
MKTFDALLREAFEAGWNQATAQLLPMKSDRELAYKKWRRELPTSEHSSEAHGPGPGGGHVIPSTEETA